ncbi:MAG: hypothetical protein GXP62_10925 [Oligoflexia bacterium]|nr:hypothetical protein [Oligoflexia bacterium]
MSGRHDLDQALDAAPQGGKIAVAGDGWSARIDASRVGPIGVVVNRLRVQGRPGDIERRAQAIATELRPQGERLDTVEVAPGLGGAVLRTRPEDMRGGRFFQVDLDEGGADLSRQRRKAEGGRQPQPFSLTREELGRVVDTLGEILSTGSTD